MVVIAALNPLRLFLLERLDIMMGGSVSIGVGSGVTEIGSVGVVETRGWGGSRRGMRLGLAD